MGATEVSGLLGDLRTASTAAGRNHVHRERPCDITRPRSEYDDEADGRGLENGVGGFDSGNEPFVSNQSNGFFMWNLRFLDL